MSSCSVHRCMRAYYCMGWCRHHYERHRDAVTPEWNDRRDEHEQRFAPQHGTRTRYRKGCRCDDCRQAETDYRRRYRQARR